MSTVAKSEPAQARDDASMSRDRCRSVHRARDPPFSDQPADWRLVTSGARRGRGTSSRCGTSVPALRAAGQAYLDIGVR